MKNVDFALFQNVWDAKRIIEACNYFIADFIVTNSDKMVSKSDEIKYKRLESVLTAFGCDIENEFKVYSLFTEKAQNELNKIFVSYQDNLIDSFDKIRLEAFVCKEVLSCYNRGKIFLQLLNFYRKINIPTNIWKNSIGYNTTIAVTHMLYEKELTKSNATLEAIMAILLLGDNYDKVYLEENLIKNYNYPTITDEELQNIK